MTQENPTQADGTQAVPGMPTSVEIARQAAEQTADEGPGAVGDFLRREDLGGGVYDFRFDSGLKGYEHWEWAVTLFHDAGLDEWTVNEAALLPTKRSLVAPQWVPFRDRLPGQADDDEEDGLEPGLDEAEGGQQRRDRDGRLLDDADSDEDIAEAISRFYLTRRLVPSPKGLQDTAQRWDDGRSRLRRHHDGGEAVTDGFVVPLEGFLGRMYGVCTNKHCRYDGKVVPLDHTCADPDEYEDDLYKDLWPENDPLVDSEHIDVFDDADPSDGGSPEDSSGEPGPAQEAGDEPTLVSDPRHHDVIENIEDLSTPDDADDGDADEDWREDPGEGADSDVSPDDPDSQDESLLAGGDETDPRRARAVQQGFTRVRRRRRRR